MMPSGVLPLADMGSSWTAIRDASRAGAVNSRTVGLQDVARKIDEMHTFAALMLSTEIGEDVDVIHPKAIRDRPARIDSFVKAMIDGDPVTGRLRIPHTAGDLYTEIDLRAQQMMASVEVKAPDDKGARGRIGWIVSQLADADGEVVVEAYAKNARVPTSATLDSVRGNEASFSVGRGAEPYRFVIKRRVAMPHGRNLHPASRASWTEYMALLAEFYEEVVQGPHLLAAICTLRKAPAEAKELEPTSDDWAWSPTE